MATPTKRKKRKLLRVMVNANILIAGIGWPRFPYEVLRHAAHGDFRLLLCPFIIKEARKHTARLFPEESATLEAFFTNSHYLPVSDPSKATLITYEQFVRDPKDIPISVAAIQAKVDFLVTQDKT